MRYSPASILALTEDLVVANRIVSESRAEYDWIDAVGIPQRPRDINTCLLFGSYSDGSDGWHTRFDRRPNIQRIITEKGWHGVVDQSRPSINGQHFVVTSIKDFSRRIYSDARKTSSPFVIGVTGSVGKTTTVAFLEHLISSAGFEVVRFWSKRLTPLIIETHYVNRVSGSTEFVVLEYSAFKSGHVARLAQTLPPNLSFFINLYNQHIRADLFRNKGEVFESKIRIKPETGEGFLNSAILGDLAMDTPAGWRTFSSDTEFAAANPFLPPTVRTGELHAVGRKVAETVGISIDAFRKAFASFVPKQDRVITCSFEEGSLFFDSEAPHGPRLWSWFETVDRSIPTLLVEHVDFGHDDTSTYIDMLSAIFASEETYVLDTEANRANIPVPVSRFVNRTQFRDILLKRLSTKSFIVYHKTVKGTIPGFVPSEHLGTHWALKCL